MTEPNTLLLRETGIARLADDTEAVNVGPIVVALGFLTEGRGEDRGTDEHGKPLPDLLSLAFDVVQSIILGGRAADYFRNVKQDFDAQAALEGKSSLALAKQAATVRRSTPSSALEKAATELRGRLDQLAQLSLDDAQREELQRALDGFRDFGAERWVAATSHLLLAFKALEHSAPAATASVPGRARKAKNSKAVARKPKAPAAAAAVARKQKPRAAPSRQRPAPRPAKPARAPKKKARKRAR